MWKAMRLAIERLGSRARRGSHDHRLRVLYDDLQAIIDAGQAARPPSGQSPSEVLGAASLTLVRLEHELMLYELADPRDSGAQPRCSGQQSSRHSRPAVLTDDLRRLRQLTEAARQRLESDRPE
jgi:hypothetical protein